MSPVAICRALGEPKLRAMFLELTTEGMKKVMKEARVAPVRLASHTTTRKRNEDWAGKVWRAIVDKPEPAATPAAVTVLFEWLSHARRPMLAAFLDELGVQHDHGMTEADFLQTTPPEKLVAAGRKLLEQPRDKQEVAAYLLFLEATNKGEDATKESDVFAPLELSRFLSPAGAAPGATSPA